MFFSVKEFKKKIKKDKYSLSYDEIFVPRMLKTKVNFYFYSDSHTGLIKSHILFWEILYNYHQVFISQLVRANVKNSEFRDHLFSLDS